MAGDTDRGADRIWGPATSGPAHLTGVCADQCGRNVHGGFSGPVRAEQREDRALWYVQVDAVEDNRS